jgi:hypothetical protein
MHLRLREDPPARNKTRARFGERIVDTGINCLTAHCRTCSMRPRSHTGSRRSSILSGASDETLQLSRTATVCFEGARRIRAITATCNREAEGSEVVGGAAATYSRGGAEITSHDWFIGSELTQFDADTYVLARAAEVMAQCYTLEVAPPLITYLFCSSVPALQAIQNPWSIKAQSYVLRFHKALTTFFSTHRGCFVLCWAPKDDQLEGNWLAHSLASQACRKDLADLPDCYDYAVKGLDSAVMTTQAGSMISYGLICVLVLGR